MSEPTDDKFSTAKAAFTFINASVDSRAYAGLRSDAKALFVPLVRHASWEGEQAGQSYCGATRLASESGLTVRSVRRGLLELHRVGFLRSVPERQGGGRSTATRQLTMPMPTSDKTVTGDKAVTAPVTVASPHPCQGRHRTGDKAVTQTTKRTTHSTTHGTTQSDAAAVSALILPFEGDEFKKKWTDYRQHRKELKKTLTPTNAEALLEELAAMGEAGAVAALKRSIAAGWQGVFADKNASKATNKRAGEYEENIVL